MKPVVVLLVLAAPFLVSCETKNLVYNPPRPQPETIMHERQVNRTVYVQDETPTALPGQARTLPEPGEPNRFRTINQ